METVAKQHIAPIMNATLFSVPKRAYKNPSQETALCPLILASAVENQFIKLYHCLYGWIPVKNKLIAITKHPTTIPEDAILYLPERMKRSPAALTTDEYEELIGWLDSLDIDEGFIQDLEDSSGWLPDFQKFNPFPEEFSEVIWHWK